MQREVRRAYEPANQDGARRSAATEAATPYRLTLAAAAATCLLTPAYVLRPRIIGLPTTVLELALLATLAIYLAEHALRRDPLRWTSPVTLPIALFLAAGAIAVVVSPDHRAAIGLYKAYLLEPVAFFVVLTDVLRSSGRALLVLGALCVAGAVAGLANATVVLQAVLNRHVDLAIAQPVTIYNNPNAVPLFLVPLMGMAAALALTVRGRLRLAAIAFLVVALAASVLSFSRGGLIALAAVALALAVASRRRVVLVPAVLVGALALSRVPPVAARLAHEFSAGDPNNTLRSRLVLWQATLRMLRDHVLTGAGLSGFKPAIAPYQGAVSREDLVYPHNILLNFWSELGLLGVAAFAWIVAAAASAALRAWRELPPPWSGLGFGVLLALIAIGAHGLVDVPYFKNDLSVEFWTLLALPVAGLRWARNGPIRAIHGA